MSLTAKIRQLLSTPAPEPTEMLADLLLAARHDAGLREQILALLKLPTPQRESLIHTALHEMQLRGEPPSACAAFAALATLQGAETASQALREFQITSRGQS